VIGVWRVKVKWELKLVIESRMKWNDVWGGAGVAIGLRVEIWVGMEKRSEIM
jgi:hypothetical protein